ncbi:restriction endonuclease [Streptomyces sp. NPDC001584]|uniref:restriction endonuclease n=1 Tax=Streptomyces sp. NPDC001584 TaxID=3154521 RepID=UPI003326F003
MSTYQVLEDPDGMLEAELPLDRATHAGLMTAVLGWTDPVALQPRDYEQIALQLTAYARAVASDLEGHVDRTPADDRRRALAELVLGETARRLPRPYGGTMGCAQSRARLLRALYERLDRFEEPGPARLEASSP